MIILKKNSSEGFTLIEVLIAFVIVFSCITLAVMAFTNVMNVSRVTERSTRISTVVPLILSEVDSRVRSAKVEEKIGKGSVIGVTYEWTALPNFRFPPNKRFDPEAGNFLTYNDRFAIYKVTLKLIYAGSEVTYVYDALGWEKDQVRPSSTNE